MTTKYQQLDGLYSLFFIGDVHAQDNKVDQLLKAADFLEDDEDSRFYDTKLVFVGDLIDNTLLSESDHQATLTRVKRLVDNDRAYCLMGNHEFNAIGWALQKQDGSYCRDHDKSSNRAQHQQFLDQVGEDHKRWVAWFKTLPLFIDFGTVRAVHACWDHDSIEKIKPYLNDDNTLKEAHWFDAFDSEHELYDLCEILLKGPESALPEGQTFLDKNGTERTQVRDKWWESYSENCEKEYANNRTESSAIFSVRQAVPVVVGHYTLPNALTKLPAPLCFKVICVDYNAALKDNPLVGYNMPLDDEFDEEENRVNGTYFEFYNQPELARHIVNGIGKAFQAVLKALPEYGHEPVLAAKLHKLVQHTLLHEWDPIGVAGDEGCENEYYAYRDGVMRCIAAGHEDLAAAYLLTAASFTIGMSTDSFFENKCCCIAYDLNVAWKGLQAQHKNALLVMKKLKEDGINVSSKEVGDFIQINYHQPISIDKLGIINVNISGMVPLVFEDVAMFSYWYDM